MTPERARIILAAVAVYDQAFERVRDLNRHPNEPALDEEAVAAAEELKLAYTGLDYAIRIPSDYTHVLHDMGIGESA